MTVEGWMGFQTGILLSFLWAIIIYALYKLRERIAYVEVVLGVQRKKKKEKKEKPKDL